MIRTCEFRTLNSQSPSYCVPLSVSPRTLTMKKLLPSSVISKLFLPCYSTLHLFLLKPILQLHSQASTAVADSFNFAFFTAYRTLPSNKSISTGETKTGTFHYTEVLGERILCVFCMSDVGEGDEVRKINCSHLFHSNCLDKWLEHRRTHCPLCRCSLVFFEAAKKPAEEVEDEEVEDSAPLLLAFLQREWWGVVHPLN